MPLTTSSVVYCGYAISCDLCGYRAWKQKSSSPFKYQLWWWWVVVGGCKRPAVPLGCHWLDAGLPMSSV